MATQKSTQGAPDRAIELLLAEIAGTAYFTKTLFQTVAAEKEGRDDEIDALRQVVARMGWMADIALQRLGSANCMYEGDAAAWLLPAGCAKALAAGSQS